MDIYFRDGSGRRVGFISGENIKDNGGNRVGFISGNDIKDNTGSRVGYIEGSNFKDNYGTRVGYIEGNNIKDTYGSRVGNPESNASNIEMCAAALLLFGLEAKSHQTSRSSLPAREKPDGCLGWAIFILIFLLTFSFTAFIDNIRYFKYPANRKEWWSTLGRIFLLMFVLTLIGIVKFFAELGSFGPLIIMGVLLIPIILASIRRMHDIGKSGWWSLIPIVSFVMCAFFPGKIEDNPYI